MIAKELISDGIQPLKTSDDGTTALNMMDENRISHIPIVNDLDFLGLISDTDIYSMNSLDEPIGNHRLSLSRPYVHESQHFYDVIMAFSTMKLTLLPVLNDMNQYLGVITLTDMVHRLAGIAALDNPGGVIILEININNYLLTEIAQIVESNDAKVLSMYITSHPDSTMVEITLKVNKIDIGPILQTFIRYNYTIKASFSENNYIESLRERFDSLMNYLNV
jgi:CBS domain-containing protein